MRKGNSHGLKQNECSMVLIETMSLQMMLDEITTQINKGVLNMIANQNIQDRSTREL